MKKIVGKATAMAMAAVMMSGAVGATALAADAATKSESKDTKVTYTAEASYSWTVPNEVVFVRTNKDNNNKIKQQAGKVEILENRIENNYKVKVTVKGSGEEGKFTITDNTSNDTLTYNIYKGSGATPLTVGGEVMEMQAGYAGASDELTFELDLGANEKAGSYSGIATFTAEAIDTSATN